MKAASRQRSQRKVAPKVHKAPVRKIATKVPRKIARVASKSVAPVAKMSVSTPSSASPMMAQVASISTLSRSIGARHSTVTSVATRAAIAKLAARYFSSEGAREVGTVKWFDSAKGFGFITRPSGADLFVHFSSISSTGFRTLQEGQTVEFAVGSTAKGPAAVDVVARQAEI